MLFDLIVGGLFLLFVVMGAFRGTLASGLSLVSIIGGYIAAILAAAHGGATLAVSTGLPETIAPIAAGSLAFFAVVFVVGCVGFFLKRWEADQRGRAPRSAADRFGGAVLGGLRGAMIAALVAWVGLLASAAKDLSPGGAMDAAPSAEGSMLAGVTESTIEGVVGVALGDDPASRVVARIASRPGERIRSLQSVLEHRQIQEVQADTFFWTLVGNGASERALNRMSFRGISHDPALRRSFADLGLVSEAAAADSNAFRDEVRLVLDEVGPRVQGLKDDPEVRALAQDPEIVALLQSGNTVALFTNPKIRNLASKLAAGAASHERPASGASTFAPSSRAAAEPQPPEEPELSDEELRAAILEKANVKPRSGGPASPAF